MSVKLITSNNNLINLTTKYRTHPRYKEYIKYRSNIISSDKQDIFNFAEWLRDITVFEYRYF